MQATTFNYAQDNQTVNTAAILKSEATKKIIMFAAILGCLVAAINI